jgi:hypothetical protein
VVHASVKTPVGEAKLRDLVAEDVDFIVRFWYESGDAFLDFVGIDRARLGDRDNTRQRFLQTVPSGDSSQRGIAFAITVAGAFAGYTLLNQRTPEVNYSHWHITNPALRGSGLSTALYPHRIKIYFDLTPIERLIHQTRTRNAAVNRMLDKYVPVTETVHVEHPDGMALPGEFHLRYVIKKDIPSFFAKLG